MEIFNQLKKRFSVEDEKWNDYISCFHKMDVPAKTLLLREGDIPKKLFLVEKGCLRVWFNNDGKDVTFQFFFENNMVASIESFRKEIPSPVAIEAIEASTVWFIYKNDVERILQEISATNHLQNLFIEAVFERTFNYMNHFISFIKHTPQQRYQNLVREKPFLIQRVPQHYIASYLGISSVHVSRIKSKLARQKL